jgi:DNA primase
MPVREDQKLEIQQATDVVRLIGEHLSLAPRGREFVGLCPFHEDTNPSMYVSPQKQIYKCFSCGAGGDVFSFVMNYHKMTFPEALAFLAARSGIRLVVASDLRGRSGSVAGADSGELTDRELILQCNQRAVEFFKASLAHAERGSVGREHLVKRGISPAMIEEFQIGYAPDGWGALVHKVMSERWPVKGFHLAGLINPKSSGHEWYDQFRHRLMFPIFDQIGRPIAFGARQLRAEDEPKYLNSRETAVFNKSGTLYGLHAAKKPIIDARHAIIVEGYTDVIACHQAGVRNVVATLGTALTRQHLQVLSRLCERVVLIFDSDAAGLKAADRAVELFLPGSLDIAVAGLPAGLDPADLLTQPGGVEVWKAAVNAAADALEFKLGRMREDLGGAETITGREKVAERYLSQLSSLGVERLGVLRRAMLVERLAGLLGLSRTTVDGLLKSTAGSLRRPYSSDDPGQHSNNSFVAKNKGSVVADGGVTAKIKARDVAERQLIGCLLHYPELFNHTLSNGRTLDEAVTPAEFFSSEAQRLYSKMIDLLGEDGGLTLAGLLAELASQGSKGLCELATQAEWEVERVTQGHRGRTEELVTASAEHLLLSIEEERYTQTKQELTQALGADQSQLLRRMAEQRRVTPSAARIARVTPGGTAR